MTKSARIVLVDDHSLCRSGLTELLQGRGAMQVVGATGNPDDVLAIVQAGQPNLLVLDLRLAHTDGLSVLRALRAAGCDVPALILTMSVAEEDLSAALRAGVRGYLLKDMEPDDVIESIARAAQGELVVAPTMAIKLARMWQNEQGGTLKKDVVDSLTDRERQVLDHVARGKSNKAIAQALDISHNTVKLHVRHIMAKLDLNSRVEAAVFAFEHRAQAEAQSADAQGRPRKT